MLRTVPIVLVAAIAMPCLANDSAVAIGLGGLVFEQSDAVRMVREDLILSISKVSVEYAFENITDQPIAATIGFPLPPLSRMDEPRVVDRLSEIGSPVGEFETLVDDKSVVSDTHMRVSTWDGRDITDMLANLDLVPQNYLFLLDAAAIERQRSGLVSSGLDLAHNWESWIYQLTYIWQLGLRAHQTVKVHHQYAPVTGGFAVYPQSDSAEHGFRVDLEDYCPTESQLETIIASTDMSSLDPAGYVLDVEYILTTGANWAGPIGEFHLTLDAERAGAFPMLCWDGELAQVSDTQWIATAKDFTPVSDLKVGFFVPNTYYGAR